MIDRWQRTRRVYGKEAIKRFANSHIAIFGVGGVGSYAAEAILRSGIGKIDVYDFDVYEYSNFNRQLYSNEQTLGIPKVEAFRRHALLVNPDAMIRTDSRRLTPEDILKIDFAQYDYVVDAIDDVRTKICLIEHVVKSGIRLVSAMGAGNKTRPELLEISDIYKTEVCPLARMIRTEARKRGLSGFPVIFSKEQRVQRECDEHVLNENHVIGSTAFVPAAMGLIIAGKVINDIADSIKS